MPRVRCDEKGQFELDIEDSFTNTPPKEEPKEPECVEIRIEVGDHIKFGEKLG